MIVKSKANANKKVESSTTLIKSVETAVQLEKEANESDLISTIIAFYCNASGTLKVSITAYRSSGSSNNVGYSIKTTDNNTIYSTRTRINVGMSTQPTTTECEIHVEAGRIYLIQGNSETNTTANHIIASKVELFGTISENEANVYFV